MSRFSAVALLCIAFCTPAFASDEETASLVEPPAAEEAQDELLEGLSREALEDLDPDELIDLLVSTQASEVFEYAMEDTALDLVPLLVPISLFGALLLGVVSSHIFRDRKQAHLHQTLRAMIDKGVEIPPELFAPQVGGNSDMRRGFVLVSIGFSLVIMIGMLEGFNDGSWTVGLIPAFIGGAYLLSWRISQRKEKN
jgi:hypothetical protein